jgi:hypothetical protein
MFLLALDSEQAAIIRHSLAAARGFMTARTERADPDGILTRSLGLQDKKVQNLEMQLVRPLKDRLADLEALYEGPNAVLIRQAFDGKTAAERLAARERLTPLILELLAHGETP